jgi:hypothetical protein
VAFAHAQRFIDFPRSFPADTASLPLRQHAVQHKPDGQDHFL